MDAPGRHNGSYGALAKGPLRRISIQCISSRALQFAIDLQSGHAYFALFGSTIRARDRTKK